jgi:hypothetical protein
VGNARNAEILQTLDRLERTPEIRKRVAGRPALPADVQALWFASAARQWVSLALVPASAELDLGELSEDLVKAATWAGSSVRMLDARTPSIEQVPFLLERLSTLARDSARVLVVLPHPSTHPASRALLEASDCFLLFVPLGELTARSVRDLVELSPPGRGLGAVAIHRKTRRRS